MNLNRRDFIKLLGMAVAAPRVGLSSEVTSLLATDGLPNKLVKKLQSKKLDDSDKQILQNMIAAGRTTEKDMKMFETCLSHPLWDKIDKRVKSAVADGFKSARYCSFSEVRGCVNMKTDNLDFWLMSDTYAVVSFSTINPENVYGWFERSERTSDYITLPDVVSKQLSPEEREWAEKLLFVVNDNLHPLLTAPYAVPTRDEFRNGDANGKIMCSVGGIFPARRAGGDVSNKMEALEGILRKRGIPEKMWEMYHKMGYVYVLSEFEGERTTDGGLGGCTREVFGRGIILNLQKVQTDVFLNPITPVPGRIRNCFDSIQKDRRRDTKDNLRATLSDLSKEKGLSMRQKKVFDIVLSQLSRVKEPQSMVMATQRSAVSGANFSHTRGGE